LLAVKPVIPAVAVTGFVDLLRLAFKIGAGQIVEQHVQLGAKEIPPLALQVGAEGVAMFEQAVQDAVKLVFAAPHQAFAQQVAHGAHARAGDSAIRCPAQ